MRNPQYAENISDLFVCPLFNSIPMHQRDEFIQDVKYTLRRFRKNDVIIAQGTEYAALHLLLKGMVTTEMADEKGEFLRIEEIKAVNPLAPGFLFAENNFLPVMVLAKSECTIMAISKENLYFLLRKYEAFMKAYLTLISGKVYLLSEKIKLNSLRTIKAKLAYYILRESGERNFLVLKTSKEELARLFGVSRPALGSVMKKLSDDGIIQLDGRRITIANRISLKKML